MSENYILLHGDVLDGLRRFDDNSVDAVVTDPPYELGFMGKTWDSTGIAYNVEVWREALRVLKPGGHLLAFGGSRTYHRLASAVEDAGFEIRDQIMWVYGSGFPKSLDVSKALDKAAGAKREVVGSKVGQPGYSLKANDTDDHSRGRYGKFTDAESECAITVPATDAAKQWTGWGTALKPAHEPIVVARKPLIGTVVQNVLQHGTGALNIDGCRVAHTDNIASTTNQNIRNNAYKADNSERERDTVYIPSEGGRWPANLIHDGSDEVLEEFAKAGESKSSAHIRHCTGATQSVAKGKEYARTGKGVEDSGTAARFFYCAKANKKDRGEGNNHPTVKPTELMRYLVRLVTPLGGLVLDPFCGSGSTGKAALLEGLRFIGIDQEADHIEIARHRIGAVTATHPTHYPA